MVDVSGIPNLGIPGLGFTGGILGGQPNVAPAMTADQINRSMWGNFSPAQAQAPLNANFANFGQQTDYYSGLGASYGRATGGFNAATPNMDARFGVPDNSSYFSGLDTPQYGGGGGYPAPAMGEMFRNYQDYQPAAAPAWGGGDMAAGMHLAPSLYGGVDWGRFGGERAPLAPDYGGAADFGARFGGMLGSAAPTTPGFDWGGYFNDVTRGAQQPGMAPGMHLAPSLYGGDMGFRGGMPSSRGLLGYDPAQQAMGPNFSAATPFDASSFGNRFGAGNYFNPGTPSQYYTGNQYGGPSALPPGFSAPYSFDNPGGALGGTPPVHYDWEPSAPAPDPMAAARGALGQGLSQGLYGLVPQAPVNPPRTYDQMPGGGIGFMGEGR